MGNWRGLNAEFSSDVTANTLAFSAGTFLCIALSDLLPELQFHEHDRVKLSLALLAGVALMAAAGGIEGDAKGDIPNVPNRPALSLPPRK